MSQGAVLMIDKKISFVILAISFLLSGSLANAAPTCKEGYQLINGQWIGTPYCGDQWLSQLSGYSLARIRNDPSVRYSLCQLYGRDPKVVSICGSDADPPLPTR